MKFMEYIKDKWISGLIEKEINKEMETTTYWTDCGPSQIFKRSSFTIIWETENGNGAEENFSWEWEREKEDNSWEKVRGD